MTREVNFDTIRSEIPVNGDTVTVRSGDTTIQVRAELPWEALVAWDNGRVTEAIDLVVMNGDKKRHEKDAAALRTLLFADHPSKPTALRRLFAIWDVDLGEPKASPPLSANGGKPSRPTSKKRTG